MAIREIITEGNPTLRKHSREVTRFDDRLANLVDDMKETLKQHNGVGLAAPQVGILRRIFVIDFNDKMIEFINPTILSSSGEQTDIEGCLSVPGTCGEVTRPYYVTVSAQDKNGEKFELSMEAIFARCACHENDHLDGILYIDKAKNKFSEDELDEMNQESEAK